jgi:hypothetical protein
VWIKTLKREKIGEDKKTKKMAWKENKKKVRKEGSKRRKILRRQEERTRR